MKPKAPILCGSLKCAREFTPKILEESANVQKKNNLHYLANRLTKYNPQINVMTQ